ncbi:MAG: hypothetical protein LUD68_09915 [Rikenellaceae bacterium]|nr:hypothetical protein [Rikenellaceae bacterium]
MDFLNDIFQGESARVIMGVLIFVAALAGVILIYRFVTRKVAQHVDRSPNQLDGFVVEVLKLPFLFVLIWVLVKLFSRSLFADSRYYDALNHGLEVLLIAAIGWILIKVTRIIFYYLEKTGSADRPKLYRPGKSNQTFDFRTDDQRIDSGFDGGCGLDDFRQHP